MLVAGAMLLFPKLALGLSGFETGVAVMPLVRGHRRRRTRTILQSRIRNTRKLLTVAALIMSVMLIGSAIVTTTMIPAAALQVGGEADGRALAYLAHRDLGDRVRHDLRPGRRSACSGSPARRRWPACSTSCRSTCRATAWRPTGRARRGRWCCIITGIALLVTIVFDADVNAQGGAYATGVLMLMTSAAIAVAIAVPAAARRLRADRADLRLHDRRQHRRTARRHSDRRLVHRRDHRLVADLARAAIDRDPHRGRRLRRDRAAGSSATPIDRQAVRIIASRPNTGPAGGVRAQARGRADARTTCRRRRGAVPRSAAGRRVGLLGRAARDGRRRRRLPRAARTSPAIPNAIAGLLLDLRDRTDAIPHAYFGWTEGNPIAYLLKFLAFGEGDTAPVTREVLRKAEPNPERRPRVHVG